VSASPRYLDSVDCTVRAVDSFASRVFRRLGLLAFRQAGIGVRNETDLERAPVCCAPLLQSGALIVLQHRAGRGGGGMSLVVYQVLSVGTDRDRRQFFPGFTVSVLRRVDKPSRSKTG
jgi:hypothetical protein